jgi:uncharacterized integral membrane protein
MNQPSEYRSSEPQQSAETPWRLIIFAVIAVVTVIFILQNRERTNIDFLFIEFKARVWTSLLIALVLGIVLDRLFIGWWRRRKASRNA